jgi:hypothetical protein
MARIGRTANREMRLITLSTYVGCYPERFCSPDGVSSPAHCGFSWGSRPSAPAVLLRKKLENHCRISNFTASTPGCTVQRCSVRTQLPPQGVFADHYGLPEHNHDMRQIIAGVSNLKIASELHYCTVILSAVWPAFWPNGVERSAVVLHQTSDSPHQKTAFGVRPMKGSISLPRVRKSPPHPP